MKKEDKVKKRPIPFMTAEEFGKIKSDADAANEILSEGRFSFARDYLRNQKETIVDYFINNKIKKTVVVKKGETEDQHIEYSKEDQEKELSGEFNYIFKFISFLESTVQLYKEAEKARQDGRLLIET